MSNNAQSLRTVALGLGFVYAGLCLLIVGLFWVGAGSAFVRPQSEQAQRLLLLSMIALPLVAVMLDVAGRALCLTVPSELRAAKVIIYISVVLSLGSIVLSLLRMGELLLALGPLPPIIVQIEIPLALLGAMLFLLFLRSVALYVQNRKLALHAVITLCVGVVATAAYVWMSNRRNAPTGDGLMYALGVSILGIATLLLYGNLLTYLRTAILEYLEIAPLRTAAATYAGEPAAPIVLDEKGVQSAPAPARRGIRPPE
jgi:hypothetical protein